MLSAPISFRNPFRLAPFPPSAPSSSSSSSSSSSPSSSQPVSALPTPTDEHVSVSPRSSPTSSSSSCFRPRIAGFDEDGLVDEHYNDHSDDLDEEALAKQQKDEAAFLREMMNQLTRLGWSPTPHPLRAKESAALLASSTAPLASSSCSSPKSTTNHSTSSRPRTIVLPSSSSASILSGSSRTVSFRPTVSPAKQFVGGANASPSASHSPSASSSASKPILRRSSAPQPNPHYNVAPAFIRSRQRRVSLESSGLPVLEEEPEYELEC